MELQHGVQTDTIPIIDWDGNKRIVYLDETWHDMLGTHDSNWIEVGGHSFGDWLHYINPLGVKWRARTDCENHPDGRPVIQVRATIAEGEHGNDGADRLGILIKDWNGKGWAIEFLGPSDSNTDKKPKFMPHDLALGVPGGY